MNSLHKNILQTFFVILLTGCWPWSPQPCCPPLPEEEIKLKAREETVMITGKGQGTGVIIGKDGYNHYVLTSRHTVADEPAKNVQIPPSPTADEKKAAEAKHEDPYKVVVYDGKELQEYVIDNVIKDSLLDLAIIQFNSESKSKKYKVARLSSLSFTNNQITYIYGFKDCFDQYRLKREEFNQGKILSDKKTITEKNEGYTVNYTNPTIRGMSGSPVYDQAGRVISIHGKPGVEKGDYSFRTCISLNSSYGNNYGISIETFKNSELAKSLPFKLAFEERPIDLVGTKDNRSNNSSPNDTSNGEIRFKKVDSK